MSAFSQGDRGKPGPVGPSGDPGEKVRGHCGCFIVDCISWYATQDVFMFMSKHVLHRDHRDHRGQEDNQVML